MFQTDSQSLHALCLFGFFPSISLNSLARAIHINTAARESIDRKFLAVCVSIFRRPLLEDASSFDFMVQQRNCTAVPRYEFIPGTARMAEKHRRRVNIAREEETLGTCRSVSWTMTEVLEGPRRVEFWT